KGKGIPCIYLHGGPGYWGKSFQHVIGDELEVLFDMVYLDQRGCGRSEWDKEKNYSLHRLIEDIVEVRKQLGIEKWFLMGHSFGGILAVNYAKHFPEHTLGIILSNVTLNMRASFMHQIHTGRKLLNM